MKRPLHPLRWLPPFLVGVAGASLAEVAVGLLLYDGPGMLRSLTALLAVESAALGLGLWMAPDSGSSPDLVDAIRGRWLLYLATILAATVFTGAWSLLRRVGSSPLEQGLGLAFLAALPLYACGALLGAMTSAAADDPSGRSFSVGGPAALGATLGFASTGLSVAHVLTPASLLLTCVVLVSIGGLTHSAMLDRRLRVHRRAALPSPFGEVRVEDRDVPGGAGAARVLLEGDQVRSWHLLNDDPGTPWEVALFHDLLPEGPSRALLVGGGASSLPAAARERSSATLEVLERNAVVVELARTELDGSPPGGAPSPARLHVGNLEDLLEDVAGPYELVLVDRGALGVTGGMGALSRRARASLAAGVGPEGVLALGPGRRAEALPPPFDSWNAVRYARPITETMRGLDLGLGEEEEVVLIAPTAGRPWPDRVGDFVRDAVSEGP